jgi:uncharacterized protein
MTDSNVASGLVLSWHTSISEIGKAEWNILAERLPTPILDYEWLELMERSGSVRPETGWLPCHLALRRDKTLVAAAPLYVKGHSQGEFVWDYMWADVAEQLKIQYYPKLIGMSPATPAVGYRFLIAPEEDETKTTGIMLDAINRFCEANHLSGAQFNFVDPEWGSILAKYDYSGWFHQSYEWYNTGFTGFDDYLTGFRKNQRRNIRRERESVADEGIDVRMITGDEIDDSLLPVMWRYYERTNDQFGPWAAKYLTREFFSDKLLEFRHRLLFAAAYVDGKAAEPIAMSMLLAKDEVIIGRYWGTDRMVDGLHFDLCYYAPIEWAILRGVARFDPGAGSPHKLRRGFLAVGNYSYHRFTDERFRGVMTHYIDEINRSERERIDEMNGEVPLKEIPRVPSMLAGFAPARW